MANMMTRMLSWPALLFTFATWVVFLAGIACLQHQCQDGTTGNGQVPYGVGGSNTYGTAGAWGWSPTIPCTRFFRFYWFIIAFTFVTLVGALIAAGPRLGLASSRPFWIGMFAINALLFMIASEATLAALDVGSFTGGRPKMCMRTAAAGAIMSVVGCIALLLTIGTDWEYRHGRTAGDKGVGTGYGTREARREEGLPVANPAGAAAPVTYTGTTVP